MRRPIIGLTTYVEPASWGLNRHVPAVALHQAYVQMVTEAGGRAVLLPPDDLDVDILDRLDGIVFAGGADVNPRLYGQEPHTKTYWRADRDAGELLLAHRALELDLPVLGVCRGMQLLAVATGGALHQHLPDLVGTDVHRPAPFHRAAFGEHAVHIEPGTRCHDLLGGDVKVNSLHHQAVADPGAFTAVAWCIEDGVIEAIEWPGRTYAVGVQWHPEIDGDPRMFRGLVASARGR